jgi:aldehyde:ferredoxin oxidoreductase
MARASWINDDTTPDLDAHVGQLEHFTQSLADGVIDAKELATQEQNLVTAMKAVESSLSDEQHAKVTRLLAEVAAYSVMRTLHELAQARVQSAVAAKPS